MWSRSAFESEPVTVYYTYFRLISRTTNLHRPIIHIHTNRKSPSHNYTPISILSSQSAYENPLTNLTMSDCAPLVSASEVEATSASQTLEARLEWVPRCQRRSNSSRSIKSVNIRRQRKHPILHHRDGVPKHGCSTVYLRANLEWV